MRQFVRLGHAPTSDRFPFLSTEFPSSFASSATGGISSFFAGLKPSLPRFVSAMELNCDEVQLAAMETRSGFHILGAFMELRNQPGRMLFGKAWSLDVQEISPPSESCLWLPSELRSWYAKTDGLQWGRWETGGALKSKDFPVTYAGGFSVETYCEVQGLNRSAAKKLYERLGSEDVLGWLFTEHPQAIFIDRGSQSGYLYHVRGSDFDDVVKLDEPAKVLDAYFSVLISQGPTPSFDFRRLGSEL